MAKKKTFNKDIRPKETVATILEIKITSEEFNKSIKTIKPVK